MERTKLSTPINPFGLPNIVIPAEVLFNEDLTNTEKILFGFLSNLTSNEQGYCWASNRYLGRMINVRPETVSAMIGKLTKHGYLYTQQETRYDGTQVRKIWIDVTYPQKYQEMLQEALRKIFNPLKRSIKGSKAYKKDPPSKTLSNIDTDIENKLDNKYISDPKGSEDETKEKEESSSKESKERIVPNKEKKKSIQERSKKYIPLAEKLASIIQSNKKIKVTQSKIKSWSNEFRILIETQEVSPQRVQDALDWYADNIGGQYIPVIESGSSFRDKFTRLEAAMERNNNSSKSTQAKQPSKSVKQIIDSKFKNKDLRHAFLYQCFKPAKELLPDSSNGLKADTAQRLIQMYDYIDEQRDKHFTSDLYQLLPDTMDVIYDYIKWIESQGWIKDRSPKLFDPSHTLFQKFRRYEASCDNMERDPLTGEIYN